MVIYGMDQPANLLLDRLPVAERRRLLASGTMVDLKFGQVLSAPGKQIGYIYFPTSAIISLISSLDGRARLEVGLVSAEGMLGISLLVGVDRAPLVALVQGAGNALRIEARRFSRVLKHLPVLQTTLMRYLYVLMTQLAQMAACTRFHLVEARLARWLLMTRDRAHSNQIHLTQEFLAYMLGVRRVGITGAARALQQRNLIRYSRGRLTILNGPGLKEAACECYEAELKIYDRLMR